MHETLRPVRQGGKAKVNGADQLPKTDSLPTPLLQRWHGNPILSPEMLGDDCACIFNSGVVNIGNELVMLANLWDAEWRPRFLVARSQDGYHFALEDQDLASPPEEYPYVPHEGIFDTRITPLEDAYYITYNVASHLGGRIRLARTVNFNSLEDLGFIAGPDHRNCTLFSEKINGRYARLERPHGTSDGDIYLSYSPDLVHWGDTSLVLEKNQRYWESAKIGPGAPPLKTDEGWLVIYHGCRQSMNGFSYQAGAMLLDLENPSRVIGKMRRCLMTPQESYERVGNVPNVVFPTAVVRHGKDADELKIYYGAADTCMCVATASETELVNLCLADGPPEQG